ncbi:PIN domain-containing protein [Levilactobacillus brevis]|uniref:PIN domain-containing protein n=1 Tax=Levilactobacillus brevis TaxID=1580 RepID=UPI00226EB079|nr:PIN domain-containing protein [Levilactobacillus brevis]
MINCKSVIDLASIPDSKPDIGKPSEGFYVDTNIWYDITYEANPDSDSDYPLFISKLKRNLGAKLLRSKLSFSELANIIDRNMCENYNDNHLGVLSRKQFRKIIRQREQVIQEIDNSLKQVESLTDDVESEKFEEVLNYISETQFIDTLGNTFLDPTDVLMVNIVKANGVQNIITKDRDYLSVPDIFVITLDERAIEEAKDENKFLTFSEFLNI